jgi:hypothetical protein
LLAFTDFPIRKHIRRNTSPYGLIAYGPSCRVRCANPYKQQGRIARKRHGPPCKSVWSVSYSLALFSPHCTSPICRPSCRG